MSDREDFDDWLVAMDDKLEMLLAEVPEAISDQLDYSVGSLSVLETWLLSSFTSAEHILKADKHLLDRLSCYVGETFRKNIGGAWTIDYSDEDDVFYGLPVISRD